MLNPEYLTKDYSVPVMPEKNDDVLIVDHSLQSSPSDKKILESPRNSTSFPVVSPTTANNSKSYGSRDETFFDSQQWLQSDSDDDFHSVNGDFTPKTSFSDRPCLKLISSSPTPQLRRKKLGELFRDSIREEREESSEVSSAISTPYLSSANSGEFKNSTIEGSSVKKKKSNWQHHRCLLGFSSCGGSFMERRKKMSSDNGFVAVN